MRQIDNYINGSLQCQSTKRMSVEDPSTGEL